MSVQFLLHVRQNVYHNFDENLKYRERDTKNELSCLQNTKTKGTWDEFAYIYVDHDFTYYHWVMFRFGRQLTLLNFDGMQLLASTNAAR